MKIETRDNCSRTKIQQAVSLQVCRLLTILLLFSSTGMAAAQAIVTGELLKWHTVTVTFAGPSSSETATPSPFLDYRLMVTFKNSDHQFTIPGYYAADGNAAQTSSESGNKWRAHFTPDCIGEWTYTASFRSGKNIAIDLDPTAGTATSFDGASGSFVVEPSDKQSPDFRAKGRLQYVGEHYLQFAETKDFYIKVGTQSPENLFAYVDFDNTEDWGGTKNDLKDGLHRYEAHIKDWKPGDPTWQIGKGKGIIGALNYLSSKGMNAVWSLTMNYKGDGSDTCPWIAPEQDLIYDCSKLDQWNIVVSHMSRLGILWHVITQEEENDYLLDGHLSDRRKLYYRELIARFGHHLAVEWDLGEENDHSGQHSTEDRMAYCQYITALDPYGHSISTFNWGTPEWYEILYAPMLGFPKFHAMGMQIYFYATHTRTKEWVDRSAETGHKWLVYVAEESPISHGVVPDANDYWHDQMRKQCLWGNLMAGGAGVEAFFGYKFPHNDMDLEDWRTRDHMWDLMHYAWAFFQDIPFVKMHHADELTTNHDDYVFALPGEIYVIYLPYGRGSEIDLRRDKGQFVRIWYNPRTGEYEGKPRTIKGGKRILLKHPPADIDKDWVILLKRK
ncbi:DUF5060 domain-containing protein [Planctomycetota bacterium]